MDAIYQEGYLYKKAGVLVSSFVPDTERITSLFDYDYHKKHVPVMKVIDQLNKRLGADKLKLASMDVQRTWKMHQKNLSKRYSTDIRQVIEIKV